LQAKCTIITATTIITIIIIIITATTIITIIIITATTIITIITVSITIITTIATITTIICIHSIPSTHHMVARRRRRPGFGDVAPSDWPGFDRRRRLRRRPFFCFRLQRDIIETFGVSKAKVRQKYPIIS
jgi:pimeloyl-ACP methyl ester carboxylesterase